MRLIGEKICLTYQYDNDEEALRHIETLNNEGWKEKKISSLVFEFSKTR